MLATSRRACLTRARCGGRHARQRGAGTVRKGRPHADLPPAGRLSTWQSTWQTDLPRSAHTFTHRPPRSLRQQLLHCFGNCSGEVLQVRLSQVGVVVVHPVIGDDGLATIGADPLHRRDVQAPTAAAAAFSASRRFGVACDAGTLHSWTALTCAPRHRGPSPDHTGISPSIARRVPGCASLFRVATQPFCH